MSGPASDDFMSEEQLQAATEARRKRRAEFVETIKKAGLDPTQIDVTMVMSDEEQAKLIRERAARAEAHRLAEKLGSAGLREKFKRTVETHVTNVDRATKRLSPEELKRKLDQHEGNPAPQ